MNETHGHYADEIHGAAEEHHRHYDTESELRALQSLVAALREDLAAPRITSVIWRPRRHRPGSSSWRPTSPPPISPSPATTAGLPKAPAGTARPASAPECYDPEPGQLGPGPQAKTGREPEP